ncbi:hypothetical protein MJG53_018220 [Ovis ammon polii x Ovis aries]|uniref:Uncharacterized protein n=1 Tax=Ovis ammon polii x Ovis aries TaxID=2918886 RepID=A0ACB9U763_9CETA|nr:hypothetical protein MJG53_018220 [Ovis ammon polii x Ovis aries]
MTSQGEILDPFILSNGDGQVDFDEFMTILGPKLVSSEGRDGFLGNTIDSIFWQVLVSPYLRGKLTMMFSVF